jgi:hypothetical protein
VSTTFPDWSAELSEALWEAATQFGVQLEVNQQVAIARAVATRPREAATPDDVRAAFLANGLPRPSAAYAKAVLASVRGVTPERTLLDVLIDFRAFAIDVLSREFGGKTLGRENELRNYLRTYLPEHGYAEAHTGRGMTDIDIPKPVDAVIECKVWTTRLVYDDGVTELGRYIVTRRPQRAYMVVFGDRDPLPAIAKDHREPIAEKHDLEGLTVPVLVVPFEVISPSTVGRDQRRRGRGKH